MTWDRARGACFREGGDIVSLNNAERVWFDNFTKILKRNSKSDTSIMIFINLHEFLYCTSPTDWCWSNKVRQQGLDFPQWYPREPNNGGVQMADKNCAAFKLEKGNNRNNSLNDIGCNTQVTSTYQESELKIILICDTSDNFLMPNINPTASQIGIGILPKDSSLFNQTKVDCKINLIYSVTNASILSKSCSDSEQVLLITLSIAVVVLVIVVVCFLIRVRLCHKSGPHVYETPGTNRNTPNQMQTQRIDAINERFSAEDVYQSLEYDAYAYELVPPPTHVPVSDAPGLTSARELENVYYSGGSTPINSESERPAAEVGEHISYPGPPITPNTARRTLV